MTEFEELILKELKDFEKHICEKVEYNSTFDCSKCPFVDGIFCDLKKWKSDRNIK